MTRMNVCTLFVLFIVVVIQIWLSKASEQQHTENDDVLPNDPYMSYLLWPHFHFSGTFRADTSTVNNFPYNFNTETFVAADQLQNHSSNSWNPRGSGEWSITGSVTHVCYANGSCVGEDEGDQKSEPLLREEIIDGGNQTWGKLVDLDTQAQMFSEIWGWRIRVGNLFSADYTPVPFQYLWKKVAETPQFGSPFGAAYQSVLTNIRWIDNETTSPFIQQLRKAMDNENITNDTLSIRLNVDIYQKNFEKDNFTTGRITGTIGLLGTKSPPFFTLGRMMKSLVNNLQDTPFYVDQRLKKVFVDFGNSLPVYENGTFATSGFAGLVVALPANENPSLNCSDELLWLGTVYDTYPNWYRNSAGVQIFPALGSLTANDMEKLNNRPLVVAEASGNLPVLKCKRILLAEAKDGIDIHPLNKWTFRKNPGENAAVDLFATKFGKPLPNETVLIDPCNCENLFSPGPEVGQPPLPCSTEIITNETGIARFSIEAKDPQNYRKYIDGQLYPFFYAVKNQTSSCSKMCNGSNPLMLLNSVFVLLVWDNYKRKGDEATWLDDVYPIFKQYANLYPVMTENFVDLGNYYEVKEHLKAINMTLRLPMSHPNHMPVTRDLSASKRQVILEWLSNEKLPKGEPQDYYSVENLRKDLQTALELEHSTIPPYLTALASIKHSFNHEIHKVIRSIVIEEMMHLTLVANILNAVGGKPLLYSKDFLPHYPSRMPGGLQPDLIIPIEKLSLGLIRNIFMKIEQPTLEQKLVSSYKHTYDYARHHRIKKEEEHCVKTDGGTICKPVKHQRTYSDPLIDGVRKPCILKDFNEEKERKIVKKLKQGPYPSDDLKIVKHHNTIGGFYMHILHALGNLTDCGLNHSIFTGNESLQVDFRKYSVHHDGMKVTNYSTAVEAIRKIVDQGEGSSVCNPLAWSYYGEKQLSHYFLFYSVVEKRELQVVNSTKPPDNHQGEIVLDYSKMCNGIYYFNGSEIPFDPEGVWPMISNPRMEKYVEGSKAYRQAVRFNKIYTKLLKSLENVFNGHPETLDDALGLMYSVDLHLTNLLRTPIYDNGDPYIGPNAGPTFDFTPV